MPALDRISSASSNFFNIRFDPGALPKGGNSKDSLCCLLHVSIPGKGPLPVCPGRPSVDRHTLLQVLLAGQQLLLLDQQALNVGLDLHMHLKTLTPMSLNVQVRNYCMRRRSGVL